MSKHKSESSDGHDADPEYCKEDLGVTADFNTGDNYSGNVSDSASSAECGHCSMMFIVNKY